MIFWNLEELRAVFDQHSVVSSASQFLLKYATIFFTEKSLLQKPKHFFFILQINSLETFETEHTYFFLRWNAHYTDNTEKNVRAFVWQNIPTIFLRFKTTFSGRSYQNLLYWTELTLKLGVFHNIAPLIVNVPWGGLQFRGGNNGKDQSLTRARVLISVNLINLLIVTCPKLTTFWTLPIVQPRRAKHGARL